MTSHLCHRSSRAMRIATVLLAALVLAACSSASDSPNPTSTPASAPNATAAPGQLTVQALTDRVNAAWTGVTALRVTSASGPIPVERGSGPGTSVPQGSVTIEEWTAPNTRRITEIVNGEVINEQVYIDGVVYMKGDFVGAAVAPEVGTETWVTLDPLVIPPDTPVGTRVAYLTREARSPFTGMAPESLAEPVQERGGVQAGGRSCTLYTFGDPDDTGEEIRYEIALDDNDLPCQVVQRGGGFQNSSVYEINSDDIRIEGPDAGTPVSGTPEG